MRSQLFEIMQQCGPHDKGIVFVNKKVNVEPVYQFITQRYDYDFSHGESEPSGCFSGLIWLRVCVEYDRPHKVPIDIGFCVFTA